MVTKSFSVSETAYRQFADYCKSYGLNMSKQVEMFMQSFAAEEPSVRKEYAKKLEQVRKGKFVKVSDFGARYGV